MAEGPVAVQGGLDKLKDEISCPLCLEIFEDPKVLPCHHVYCRSPCLEGLALTNGNGTISCPECRTVVLVPSNNVDNLPTAFHINRLKEVYGEMEKDHQDHSKKADRLPCCRKHSAQALAFYCETCEELICRYCVIADRQHKDHRYGYVTQAASPYRQAILEILEPIKQFQSETARALSRVGQIKAEIAGQKEAIVTEINEGFDTLTEALQEERQALVHSTEELMDRKLNTVTTQEEELGSIHSALKMLTTSVGSAAKHASNEDFLSEKQQMITKIQRLTERYTQISLKPAETPDVQVKMMKPDELRRAVDNSSFIWRLADPCKCRIEGEGIQDGELGKKATFTLHLVDSDSNPCTMHQQLTAHLKSLRQESITPVHFTLASAAHCQVSYRLRTRGRHELSVTVNGNHITNSPFPVFMRRPPSDMKDPVATIFELMDPRGVTCCDGNILVTELNGGRLSVINSSLQRVGTIGDTVQLRPTEVTTDLQSNVYVSSLNDHKVYKFNREGVLLKSVGGRGSKPGQFNCPNGMRVSKDNKLFVCDSSNHRIQVFDTELNLVKVFGRKGSRNGCFKLPADVDFDNRGNIFIPDNLNHRIQVLDPNGSFLYSFGKKGSGQGELKYPACLRIDGDNDELYVTEFGNNRVSVFNTSGRIITTFGEQHLRLPKGIAIDQDGYVYVCNGKTNVMVF